jgi:hypothetical protein
MPDGKTTTPSSNNGAPLSTVAQITPAMIGSSAASISFLPVFGSGHTISAHPDRETLVGSFQHNDTFQGTSTNLNGDVILLFGGKDVIDVTDLNFASTNLHYQGTAIIGTLDLNDGVHSTRISLAGDYHQANFHLASDMHGGTNVTYG